MDIRDTKRALRSEMREIRRRANAQNPHAALALRDNFFSTVSPSQNSIVSAYIAMDDEIDPAPIVQTLAEKKIKICLPVVINNGAPLMFREYNIGDKLIKSGFMNVLEPESTKPAIIPSIFLVPLLAFDKKGFRLGYGGGFYDRTIAFLTKNNPETKAMGLAFSAQEVASVPISKYDRALGMIITEQCATVCPQQ